MTTTTTAETALERRCLYGSRSVPANSLTSIAERRPGPAGGAWGALRSLLVCPRATPLDALRLGRNITAVFVRER